MEAPHDARTVHRYEHETWSRCADDYLDGFAGLTRETLPFLIEEAGIGAGDRVLDIGSGPGHVAADLAERGCDISGIDFSGLMVEVATRRFPHIDFQEAGAEKLPFGDATFDAVVSNFVVHHLARPDRALGEAFRVLKPGGRVAFTVFGNPEAQSTIGAFFAAVEAHHSANELPHGPLFGVTDLNVYRSLLESAGFVDCRFDFREITWRAATADPVVEAFRTWGNIGALPEDVQERIAADTRGNLEACRQPDGSFAFPHEVLLGSAGRAG